MRNIGDYLIPILQKKIAFEQIDDIFWQMQSNPKTHSKLKLIDQLIRYAHAYRRFLRTPQHAVSYVGGGVREILAARARQTLNRSAEIGGGGGGDSREKKTGGGGTTASRSYEDMFVDEVVAEDRKSAGYHVC